MFGKYWLHQDYVLSATLLLRGVLTFDTRQHLNREQDESSGVCGRQGVWCATMISRRGRSWNDLPIMPGYRVKIWSTDGGIIKELLDGYGGDFLI